MDSFICSHVKKYLKIVEEILKELHRKNQHPSRGKAILGGNGGDYHNFYPYYVFIYSTDDSEVRSILKRHNFLYMDGKSPKRYYRFNQ